MEELLTFYNLVTAILVAVWIFIFLVQMDVRREMVILGILALFLIPLTFTIGSPETLEIKEKFARICLTDLIFSFVISGIAGVIFHSVFGRHYHKLPKIQKQIYRTDRLAEFWILRLLLTFIALSWGTLLLNIAFGLNPAASVLISAIMVSIYIVSQRHDLLGDAIWSAFLTTIIVFIAASLSSMFTSTQFDIGPISSTTTIANVPIDMLVWSLALGIALGPLYEFVRRVGVK